MYIVKESRDSRVTHAILTACMLADCNCEASSVRIRSEVCRYIAIVGLYTSIVFLMFCIMHAPGITAIPMNARTV